MDELIKLLKRIESHGDFYGRLEVEIEKGHPVMIRNVTERRLPRDLPKTLLIKQGACGR